MWFEMVLSQVWNQQLVRLEVGKIFQLQELDFPADGHSFVAILASFPGREWSS
jgi:hypothetical protein|nr:hypothetical protein [Mariniblastus sp.]